MKPKRRIQNAVKNLFVQIINGWKTSIIAKSPILDVSLGSEYVHELDLLKKFSLVIMI